MPALLFRLSPRFPRHFPPHQRSTLPGMSLCEDTFRAHLGHARGQGEGDLG